MLKKFLFIIILAAPPALFVWKFMPTRGAPRDSHEKTAKETPRSAVDRDSLETLKGICRSMKTHLNAMELAARAGDGRTVEKSVQPLLDGSEKIRFFRDQDKGYLGYCDELRRTVLDCSEVLQKLRSDRQWDKEHVQRELPLRYEAVSQSCQNCHRAYTPEIGR